MWVLHTIHTRRSLWWLKYWVYGFMGVESIKILLNCQSICQRVQWSQDIKRHLLDATNAFSKLCCVQSLCRIIGLPYSVLNWNKQPNNMSLFYVVIREIYFELLFSRVQLVWCASFYWIELTPFYDDDDGDNGDDDDDARSCFTFNEIMIRAKI